MEKPEWNKITFDYMKKYIENYAPQDKDWFKEVAMVKTEVKDKDKVTKEIKYVEKNVYDHFKAREAFCKRYMPEVIPVAKEKPQSKADILANW